MAVSAIFAPGTLIIFLTHPAIAASFGMQGVLLLSIAISLPVVLLCSSLWYTFISAGVKLDLIARRRPAPEADLMTTITSEDPYEWYAVLAGGWLGNFVLYLVAVIAYFRSIRLGATLVLVVAILLGVQLILVTTFGVLTAWAEKKMQA